MEKPPKQTGQAFPQDLHAKIMHKVHRAHLKRQFKILIMHTITMATFGAIITLLIYLKESISTALVNYLLYGSIIAAVIFIGYSIYYWSTGVVYKLITRQFQTVKQMED